MIKVVCRIKLKEGVSVEEYLALAKEVIIETRKEKGCITYTINQDIEDPSFISMLEEWENQESLDNHLKAKHVLEIVPELRKLRESTELNLYKELY
ncbi:putative quinol monooxygenase [Bacillus sinesaloumensis]|uniref:putative quinol monooxygenase n=1 Tax=Litchfieldia sinesaloumensis TaxID=1926280 RepID=UPI000988856F|nr:putative quinol monooxygenase [Bacillus sinesaloumensis]